MLEAFPTEALPLGVYWVSHKEPQGTIRPWLDSRKAIWVEKGDFDELMLLIRDVFGLPHPERKRFDDVFERYKNQCQELSGRIVSLPDSAPGATALKKAVKSTDESLPGWLSVALTAKRLEKEGPDQANAIYAEGVKRFPESAPLLGNYAVFLYNIRKDYNQAEQYFRHALAAKPNNANNLGNYAGFLLASGRTQEGLSVFEKVLALPDTSKASLLAAECWFYAFAHRPIEGRAEALYNLKRVLEAGARSPGWNLGPNIAQAEKDGHPAVPWLKKLAPVITEGADIKKLDSWEDWKKA